MNGRSKDRSKDLQLCTLVHKQHVTFQAERALFLFNCYINRKASETNQESSHLEFMAISSEQQLVVARTCDDFA